MNQELQKIIEEDIYRHYGRTRLSVKEKILPYNVGLKYTIALRKAAFFRGRSKVLGAYYQYALKRKGLRYGFQIHPATQIGRGGIWRITDQPSLM